jgi:hypothetical protein
MAFAIHTPAKLEIQKLEARLALVNPVDSPKAKLRPVFRLNEIVFETAASLVLY